MNNPNEQGSKLKTENKTNGVFKKKILPVILAAAFTGAGFAGGYITSRATLDKDIDAIDFILDNYHKYYYEEQSDVVGVFADALLDKYSEYYTKEEYAAILAADTGAREGLGVVLEQKTDSESGVFVYEVYGNSPAQKAGIAEGDRILSVFTEENSTPFIVSDVNGLSTLINEYPPNKNITFVLSGNGEEKTVTLQKQAYRRTFVGYYDQTGAYGFLDGSGKMEFIKTGDNLKYPLGENKNTAVIKYSAFSGTDSGLAGSAGQMLSAMEKFKNDGKENLIVDLRGNGGGFMNIMQSVCSHFVCAENGETPVVVKVKDKNGAESLYRSERIKYNDYGFKSIVILADADTASASEAFIGAVLDHDKNNLCRVIVSGGKTYGKGIMQTTFTRITGEAVKLTTAKLFWPISDKCIHGVGVTPSTDDRVINESAIGNAFYDGLKFCK